MSHVTIHKILLVVFMAIFHTRPSVYLKLEHVLGVALLANGAGIQAVVESGQRLRQLLRVQLVLEM